MVGGSTIRIEKFNGKNSFGLLQIKMKALLKQLQIWRPLIPKSAASTSGSGDGWTDEQLVVMEEKAHSTILLSLDDHIITEVADQETAAELWLKLESLYMTKSLTNKLLLKQRLFSLRMQSGFRCRTTVILNKKREFQWQKLALFLRVGASRNGILAGFSTEILESPNDEQSRSVSGSNGIFDVSNFVLKLLPSNEGTVLRRLLMTADGTSLLRAYLSKEAGAVRQQLTRAIAEVLYQWMARVISKDPCVLTSSQSYTTNSNYQLLLTDRRLKVVFRKVLNDARRDWLLMLRFCWTSFIMSIKASAMACHRLIICLSEANTSRISFPPIKVVAST